MPGQKSALIILENSTLFGSLRYGRYYPAL